MPRIVTYVGGTTQKLFQLTGECDRERNQLTLSRTESRFGVVGTDLGSTFEQNGRIYFLFGDTGPNAEDSIAYSEDRDPESGIHLQFGTQPNNPHQYLQPTTLPPISLGAFEVPAGGFSANGKMYVFFTTDAFTDAQGNPRMGRSVLAWSTDRQRAKLVSSGLRLFSVTTGWKFHQCVASDRRQREVAGLTGRTQSGSAGFR